MNILTHLVSKSVLMIMFISLSILFLSNRNGVPQAVTKAPGESGLSCNACHVQGTDFKATVDLTIMNLDSTIVVAYEPGRKYIVRVKVAGTSSAKSYGFQMVSLAASDNKDVGVWSSLGNKVKQITLLQRKYLEQSNTEDRGLFFAQWTAPTSGDVKFYMSGLATNGNGNTSGDQAASNVKTISAVGSSSTTDDQLSKEVIVHSFTSQALNVVDEKVQTVDIYDINGVLVQRSNENTIDISSLCVGNYFAIAYNVNRTQVGRTYRFVKI